MLNDLKYRIYIVCAFSCLYVIVQGVSIICEAKIDKNFHQEYLDAISDVWG